ncbi:MAG: Neurochondrin-domain-containing protein [Linnemannia gamsii]|nr:MAG: Neurochondrin-domain-containing protein [Linnemannia gamsii]
MSESASPSPSSNNNNSDLTRCLELLRPGTSDESKFIGLTLMSDLLQISQDQETMTRFFDNMDFPFLDRMMQIEESSVPKEAGVDAITIRSIAIDVMTCFSIHWELLVRKEFKDRVPTMLSLLSASDSTDNTKKILKIMARISAYPQVSMILTNPGYQSSIVAYIFDSFDGKGEAHDDAVMVFKRTFLIIQEGFKQNPKIVVQITKDFLPTIMTRISKPFSVLTETHKPEIMQMITESVAYLPEQYVQQHVKDHAVETRNWVRNLKSGLIQLLSTRQAPTTRDDCFKMIGILLQRLGADWIFPEIPTTDAILAETRTKKKSSPATLVHSMESLSLTDAEIDKKFAALVIHLSCVETRVLMDELAEELAGTTAASNEGPDARQAKIRKEQVLPLVYEILEVSIGYLVLVSEDDELLERGLFDATALLKVQESLQAAFSAVLDYILDLQSSKDGSPEKLMTNMNYLASMRILSVWLTEDDSLHAQAVALFPTLEEVVRQCKGKSSQRSLVRLLQPILDRFQELSLD